MAKEDLLRFANDNKPAEFAAEFKTQLQQVVAQKLTAPAQTAAPEGETGE
jgi:hypothetical protein